MATPPLLYCFFGRAAWLVLAGTVCWSGASRCAAQAVTEPSGSVESGILADDASQRISALRAEISHHDELYFKRSAPVISDAAYDALKRELLALEQAFPGAALSGTPPGVGDDRTGLFPAGQHRVPMLGLAKSYSEAELRAFDARLVRQVGRAELEYVVEPKFDGLAISVTYEQGRLVRAVTRGNGLVGDDVTANALAIRTLPCALRVPAVPGPATPLPAVVELRGEVYLSYAEFARINGEREAAGEPAYAHPRNLAAGTLKQADAAAVGERRLEIVFYGLGACEPAGLRPESQIALLRQLRAWGLPTIDNPRSARGAEAMWRAVQAVGRERPTLGFPIDGAVVKLNSVALQDRLGSTEEAPLWAMAYKFRATRAETRLRGIILQVGRTGVVTPVAELDPVSLDGVTVARAALFNAEEIARRDLRVGDFVWIEKAGEVIPAIAGVNLARRTSVSHPYEFPSECPDCQTPLERGAGEVAWRCPNADCPAQVKRRIQHFASAQCVNIAGLGPAMVDKLVGSRRVRNVADLYRLRPDDLVAAGLGRGRSGERLLVEIERSKRAELWRFIHGLGIPHVGAATSRRLARQLGSLGALAEFSGVESNGSGGSTLSGLGREATRGLTAYLAREENRIVLAALRELGINPQTSGVPGK